MKAHLNTCRRITLLTALWLLAILAVPVLLVLLLFCRLVTWTDALLRKIHAPLP